MKRFSGILGASQVRTWFIYTWSNFSIQMLFSHLNYEQIKIVCPYDFKELELPPCLIFPSTYNLQIFKTRVPKNLRLHPLTWSTFPSLQ